MVSLLDLLDGEGYYDVYRSLCRSLDIVSIVRLTRTCKGLSTLYRKLLPLEWNVDHTLSRFVRDPSRLRLEMKETGAFITGRVAHSFFGRTGLADDVLRLMVSESESARLIEAYLQVVEGYEVVVREVCQFDYRQEVLSKTVTLVSLQSQIPRTGSVYVYVVPPGDAPVEVFLEGSSRADEVCLLEWNRGYCVFPRQTFQLKKMMEIDVEVIHDEEVELEDFEETRTIGDGLTWTIPLGVSAEAVDEGEVSHSVEGVSFAFLGDLLDWE